MTTKSMNGETVTGLDPDNQKPTSPSNSQEQHPNPAAAAAAEARATLANLSQALGDDDDDIKKRRRRSSLLRRSLSSNFVLGGSGSGRRPSNNSIAAAARDDLKKKSRSLRDLSELDSEDDDDDEDEDKESDQKLKDSPLRSRGFERNNRPESTDRQPVRGSRQPTLQQQYQKKSNQDDEESHIRRRPAVQRSGSFTNRTSETIHTVVNPLDVILQLHRVGDNYFYKLCPHHTGNNRVGVMVDLQLNSFIKLQLDHATKDSENKDGKSNRICEEIVRTVEEHWQGRFLLQVEEQGVIGYTLLSKTEASQAVYDIFQETIDAAAKEAPLKSKDEIIDLTDHVSSNEVSTTRTTKATENAVPPKKSVLKTTSESTVTTIRDVRRTGDEDNIVTSSIISNIEPIPLKPSNALTGSATSTASSIYPVYGEQTDVHKSALASLQRRKRRQYASTKISNLVTGRGLVPKKSDDMSVSSSISGGDGLKRDDRSVASYSSLPTDFTRENATRSYSEPIEFHPSTDDQFGQNLNRYERSELHNNSRSMYPPKGMAPLGKTNNRCVSDSQVLSQNRARENLMYQINQGPIYAKADMRRASSSTIGGASLFSINDAEEDYEPFPAQQQPHEISEALQHFQEMFSTMPSPYNPNNNLNNYQQHAMPEGRSSPYEMTSNGYYNDGNHGNSNYGQNANDGSAYDPSFAQQDYLQQQDIRAPTHGNAYGINHTIDELNPIDANLYHEEDYSLRGTSSVRFQDSDTNLRLSSVMDSDSNLRLSSVMDFSSRRSTRLSNFSQNMIQDLLFQLSASGQINLDESDDD